MVSPPQKLLDNVIMYNNNMARNYLRGQAMHDLTVKKVYFYALSFILLVIMLYSMGEIVWSLSEIIIQPPVLDIESRKSNMYFNWRMIEENMVYLAVYFPVFWYHWKVARSLE
jgi:hypothetical protein